MKTTIDHYILCGAGDEARLILPKLKESALQCRPNARLVIAAKEAHPALLTDPPAQGMCIGPDWASQLRSYFRLQKVSIPLDLPAGTYHHQLHIIRAIGRSDVWKTFYAKLIDFIGDAGDAGIKHHTMIFDKVQYPMCYTGSVFHKGVQINDRAEIGKHCIINTGAIIEHDVKIGKGSFIGPGAIILGHAEVGEYAFIGAGCIIAPKAFVPDGHFMKMGTKWTNELRR